jgi:hypothetical protein
MLVKKRSVPVLSSKAKPDCASPPLNCPQALGIVATQPGVQNWGGLGAALVAYSLKTMSARSEMIASAGAFDRIFTVRFLLFELI